jgi:PPOX class probable F420-dependent enzyme
MSDASNAEVERLGSGSYVSLTTFRRDGTAVATPVWVSRDGDRLFVWTEATSGKVKRIRNGARVLLAPCDSRGGLQGSQVEGSARVLDDASDVAHVERLHRAKYGVQYRVFDLFAQVFRRNRGGHVALELSLT